MANPFLRRPMKMSKDPNEREIPSGAIDPTLESVAGPVFAYRGQETHGVPTDIGADAADENEFNEASRFDVEYMDPEPELDPIPVYVVSDKAIEIVQARVTRMSATGSTKGTNASQLIGNDYTLRTRRKVKVKNLGAATIYIGTEAENTNAQFGWPLAANEVFETESQAPLYAVGTVADETPVAVYSEWTVNATHDKANKRGN